MTSPVVSLTTVAIVLLVGSIARAQPPNDDCANATVITSFPFTDTVDTTVATTEPGDPVPSCTGEQSEYTVWYQWTAPASGGTYFIDTQGSDYDYIDVTLSTGACGALSEVRCHFDEYNKRVAVPPGETVLLTIGDVGSGGGTLVLKIDQLDEFPLSVCDFKTEPTVTAHPNGNFLVTCEETSTHGEAQVYGDTGVPIGGVVSIDGVGSVWNAAAVGATDFIVVGDAGTDIVAQRLDATGTPLGMPFTVNTYATGNKENPDVAADGTGNFIVIWSGPGPDGDGMQARRYDSSGAPLGPELKVNATGPLDFVQVEEGVAMSPDGSALVTYQVHESGVPRRVLGQRLDASGALVGGEFQINTKPVRERASSVAADASGNFIVSWETESAGPYGYFGGPAAQRVDAAGTLQGPELLVGESVYFLTGPQRIAADPAGNFMVVWEAYEPHPISVGGRRYDANGTPLESDFIVHSELIYFEYNYWPDVAANAAGRFMVVWERYDYDGSQKTYGRVLDSLVCPSAPRAGCRVPTVPGKSKLLLRDTADDVGDQLRWTWVKGEATDPTDFGDPTAGEHYRLCLYDESGGTPAVVLEAQVPVATTCGTKPCWKGLGSPSGSKGFRYKNKARTPHGVQVAVLKAGAEGKAKIVIKGGRENLFKGVAGAPPLPLPLPATLQLQNVRGECWQATYDTDGVGSNEAGFFRGSGS